MREKSKQKSGKDSRKNPRPDIKVMDAPAQNWVDSTAPLVLRPYLRLSRLDRPIGTWLLLIPCWWGLLGAVWANGSRVAMQDIWIFIACALGAILMRGAGCTWNDITDRDFDGRVKRTASRPLPAGQVSVAGATAWMVAQIALAGAILLSFNTLAIAVGLVALLPVLVYPFAKRWTWWPQVFLGVAINWGVLLAWAASANALPPSAIILYLAGIIWTLFYDTIYAFQDTEDDALLGIKSTARLFGARAGVVLFCCGCASAAAMAGAFYLMTPQDAFAPARAVLMLAPLAFFAHLLWQLTRLDTQDSAGCLALFKKNRTCGLIVVFALLFAVALQYLAAIPV